jgi:FixJ family two-component response regulator
MSGAASILLLDPDEAFQRSVVATVGTKGFACSMAVNSEDAARRLANGGHDIFIVNVEAADPKLLRGTHGDGSPVQLLVVTGRPRVATAVQALRAGAVDYLTKPIRQADLLQAVDRAAERSRAQRNLRGAEQIASACLRWFRDVETLLSVPGTSIAYPALRHALVEQRDAGIDQVLVRCLGAHEVGALTRREREVLVAFAQGQRGRDLAKCLGVSINTCRTHLKSLLRKIGVHSQRELVQRLGGGA